MKLMMKSKLKTRLIGAVLVLVMLSAVCCSLCSCLRQPAPQLDDVRAELIALIEGSADVNTVLFGTGLPVYLPGSEADTVLHLYDTDAPDYYCVTYDCPIADTNTIRELARAVYASAYIDPILSVMLDGAIVSGGSDTTQQVLLHADYADTAAGFMQSATRTVYITENRVYLYDTMVMQKKSTGLVLYVDVDTYLPSTPDEHLTVTLSFVQENGEWKLNTPTY